MSIAPRARQRVGRVIASLARTRLGEAHVVVAMGERLARTGAYDDERRVVRHLSRLAPADREFFERGLADF